MSFRQIKLVGVISLQRSRDKGFAERGLMPALFGTDQQGSGTIGMDTLVQSQPLSRKRQHPPMKTVPPVGSRRYTLCQVSHPVGTIPFRQTSQVQLERVISLDVRRTDIALYITVATAHTCIECYSFHDRPIRQTLLSESGQNGIPSSLSAD